MRKLPAIILALAMLVPAALAGTAPDFVLRDVDNHQVRLSDLRGKVVLIDFWATWCGPCQVEMPHLDRLDRELSDQGFVVLAISADDARTATRVKPFVRSKGYGFRVLLDRQTQVVTRYNPEKVLPYAVLVGRDGQVLWRHAGYTPGDEVEMERQARQALAAPSDL